MYFPIFLFSIFIFLSTSGILLQIIFILLYWKLYIFFRFILNIKAFIFWYTLLYAIHSVHSTQYTFTLNEYYVQCTYKYYNLQKKWEKKIKHCRIPWAWLWHFYKIIDFVLYNRFIVLWLSVPTTKTIWAFILEFGIYTFIQVQVFLWFVQR